MRNASRTQSRALRLATEMTLDRNCVQQAIMVGATMSEFLVVVGALERKGHIDSAGNITKLGLRAIKCAAT